MTTPNDQENRSKNRRFGRKIERQIRLTKAVLLWEKAWPALWPGFGFVGLFLSFSLLGVWSLLPTVVHAATIAGLLVATVLSLWVGFRGIAFPTREDALRRLEKSNHFDHRILTSLHDTLTTVSANAETDLLWRAHKRRLNQQIRNVTAPVPKSSLPEKDPNAWRFAVVLLLVVSAVVAQGDWQHRLIVALSPNPQSALSLATRVDAWITPPRYTATPPVFLTQDGTPSAGSTNEPITVPEGSVLSIKVSGNTQPPTLTVSPAPEPSGQFEAKSDSVYESTLTVQEDTDVSVRQGLFSLGAWDIKVFPDTAPTVSLTGKVVPDGKQFLVIPYKAADDYGVSNVTLVISLKDKNAAVSKYYGTEHRVELAPLALDSEEINESALVNMTEHAWAGLPVDLTLQVTDELGQTGNSIPIEIVLPERRFMKPLAAAVVEQRKNLAHRVMPSGKIAKYLDALTTAPDDTYFDDMSVYLGLRAAYWRLLRTSEFSNYRGLAAQNLPGVHSQEAVDDFDAKVEALTKSTVKLLWDIALKIEDGDKSLAERELQAAQDALMEALENGASDEEISQLVADLKQALDRYLEALAKQALEEFQRTGRAPPPADPNAAVIETEDLDDLLESIQDLAETGARESARQLLSQLQGLLQNLQAGDFAPSLSPSQQAMQDALGKLGDMIGDLRGVMDETFRKDQSRDAPPSDPGDGNGEGAENGTGKSLQDLAQDQRGVGKALQQLLDELGESGSDIPSALGQADRSIERGATALDSDETRRALDQQGRAIDQLRQGAQELAQQLMDEMKNSGSGVGQGQQRGRDADPLGRPNAGAGPDFGDSVKVPNERALKRARDILQELQRRASEKSRPTPELEYLERLLKRF